MLSLPSPYLGTKNPVKRGYVDLAEHWRYSSARNYLGGEVVFDDIDIIAYLGMHSQAGAWERKMAVLYFFPFPSCKSLN